MKLEIKRGKSKICKKIGYFLRMWKKCIIFASSSGDAQSDKAIKRGRSFLDSIPYHLGGKIVRSFFSNLILLIYANNI